MRRLLDKRSSGVTLVAGQRSMYVLVFLPPKDIIVSFVTSEDKKLPLMRSIVGVGMHWVNETRYL